MNEMINLMKLTRLFAFTEEQISDKELRAIIDAGTGCFQLEQSLLTGAKQREKRSP